jgi:hypothetical protein
MQKKYLLQAVVRRDAFDTSVLPLEKRWERSRLFPPDGLPPKKDFYPGTNIIVFETACQLGQNGNIGTFRRFCKQNVHRI